jgi:hypothetical protein
VTQEERFFDDATPAEWMVHVLAGRRTSVPRGKARQALDRKLRLYAVAECRRIWLLMTHLESRRSVEAAEAYADRLITRKEMEAAREGSAPYIRDSNVTRAEYAAASVARGAMTLHWIVDLVRRAILEAQPPVYRAADELNSESIGLIRCIFGNPFRPVTFDPRWRTSDVLGLARAIYDDRAFDRLPILADALMDAGCGDEQVLGHCRGDGPHVRGCWVVDLVLEKE